MPLDEIGMEKAADGFRTLPSGEPIAFTLDISDWGGSLKVQVDAAEEMKKQWGENLGINIEIKNLQGQPTWIPAPMKAITCCGSNTSRRSTF